MCYVNAWKCMHSWDTNCPNYQLQESDSTSVYVHDTPWVKAWCWPRQDWEFRSCGMWCCSRHFREHQEPVAQHHIPEHHNSQPCCYQNLKNIAIPFYTAFLPSYLKHIHILMYKSHFPTYGWQGMQKCSWNCFPTSWNTTSFQISGTMFRKLCSLLHHYIRLGNWRNNLAPRHPHLNPINIIFTCEYEKYICTDNIMTYDTSHRTW